MRLLLFSILFFSVLGNASADDIRIGTGSKKAVFFPTSKAICELLKKHYEIQNCQALVSQGAEYNLQKLGDKFNFAVSQLPLQYKFYQKNPDLRSVATLHIEHFTILKTKDSDIKRWSDLKGKKVGIVNKGSGSRIYLENILQAFNWSLDDFAEINEDSSDQIPGLICSGKVDAIIYLVGHPNKLYQKAINCGAKIISLSRAEQDIIKTNLPNFVQSVIHKKTYLNHKKVNTVGIQTVLSTTDATPNEVVKKVISLLVRNRVNLLEINPVYKEINPLNIITFKDKAPLHDGVIEFLQKK